MDNPQTHQLKVSYDKDADVLYMSEGEPKNAICEMVDGGFVIRKDPETKRVIGFTIIDFIANFSSTLPHTLPIQARFDLQSA